MLKAQSPQFIVFPDLITKIMNIKLTRRQFGQAAIASTAAVALGTLASKTLAQTPSSTILGVRAGSITSSNDSDITEIDSTDTTDEITSIETVTSISQSIEVLSYNIANREVKTILTTEPILESSEQLSGFASLDDGTLIVAATITDTSKKAESTRLIILDEVPRIVTVSGVKKQQRILSLLRLNGSLAGILGKRNGRPPISIVSIDPETGEISDKGNKLRGNQRVTTVAQCPDGNLYGILYDERKGETQLELIVDKGKRQTTPLSFKNQIWNSGFNSLVCSPSNQLFALGALRYESPNYLHTIDKNTGEITRVGAFDVAKIAMGK
jgi:hypothetical protein